MKNNRRNVAGSLKTKMPNNTVPAAPMPVHTAYAVPMGKVCVALINNTMLKTKATRKPPYHNIISVPVDVFALPRQNAKTVSNIPAIIKMIQFILFNLNDAEFIALMMFLKHGISLRRKYFIDYNSNLLSVQIPLHEMNMFTFPQTYNEWLIQAYHDLYLSAI